MVRVGVALLTAVLLGGRMRAQAVGGVPPASPNASSPASPPAFAGGDSPAVSSRTDLPASPVPSSADRNASGPATRQYLLQRDPLHQDSLQQDPLRRTRALVQAGEFAAAERELVAALAAQPATADALFLLGYVQFRERRCRESLKSYTDGATLRRPGPDDLLVVASDYIQLKAYADAQHWLLLLTEEAPQNATAWYLLGRTQYVQDRAEEALLSFRKCLAARPRDVRAEYNEGLALERLQRPAEALAAYRLAIEWVRASGDRDPQPYLDLGTLLLVQGKTGESIAELQQATLLGPGNPLCFQQLGRALEAGGEEEKAVAAYRRAIALAPEAQRPHYFLGRLLRRLGRTQEAETELAAVARLYGNESSVETPNPDAGTAAF